MIPGLLIACVVAAFVTVIMATMSKCPLWVPVLLNTLVLALLVWPK
jgi:hypothetical protein